MAVVPADTSEKHNRPISRRWGVTAEPPSPEATDKSAQLSNNSSNRNKFNHQPDNERHQQQQQEIE